MVDYELWLTWIWVMVGVPRSKIYGPNADKLVSYKIHNARQHQVKLLFFYLIQEYFKSSIVRKTFQFILNIDTICGRYGTVPNYRKIIRAAEKAIDKLSEKSGLVKFDWL